MRPQAPIQKRPEIITNDVYSTSVIDLTQVSTGLPISPLPVLALPRAHASACDMSASASLRKQVIPANFGGN